MNFNKSVFRGGAVLALSVVLAAVASANAMQVKIAGSGTSLTVTDGGIGDIDASVNEIVVDPTLLMSTFSGLDSRSQVTASSNIATADDYRYLSTEIRLKMRGNAHPQAFEVDATQADFFTPSSFTRTIDSSFAGNMVEGQDDDGASFQGGVDATNSNPFGFTNSGGHFNFLAEDEDLDTFSFDAPTVSFSSNDPYEITNRQKFLLSSSTVVQTTSITSVTGVVPEPASMAALGFGLVALIRRRRDR